MCTAPPDSKHLCYYYKVFLLVIEYATPSGQSMLCGETESVLCAVMEAFRVLVQPLTA